MSHLSSAFALGREDYHCCGGTIVVPLDAHDIKPRREDHITFIRSDVETPLCLRDLDSVQ